VVLVLKTHLGSFFKTQISYTHKFKVVLFIIAANWEHSKVYRQVKCRHVKVGPSKEILLDSKKQVTPGRSKIDDSHSC
jgi:hypothetical protein